MLRLIKGILGDKSMAIHTVPAGTMLSVGVPGDHIPQEFLRDLCRLFDEMQLVHRAAYCMRESEEQLAYYIMLDLDVPEYMRQEALQDISTSMSSYMQVPYRGHWPLDIGLWDEEIIDSTVGQDPALEFYVRADLPRSI